MSSSPAKEIQLKFLKLIWKSFIQQREIDLFKDRAARKDCMQFSYLSFLKKRLFYV